MTQDALWKDEAARAARWKQETSPAARQPKTDRLVLFRLLQAESRKYRNEEQEIEAGHKILTRWADLEKSGRLAKLKETQLQGDFLAQVFGEALGYHQAIENADVWHQEQHRVIGPGQTPDAVLGRFIQGGDNLPEAVIELKGPKVHLDRDRSAGRTAVDQCWDYLVNTPAGCRWGIVSNIVSFRLYERDSTKRVYEHFTLQELRDAEKYRQFYSLFHRKGLIEGTRNEPPRALSLLRQTNDRQREVSDELYENYSRNRLSLIEHLHHKLGHSIDHAVEMAQRLLDRIIFIAFCEDRHLLPEKTIQEAYKVAGFHAVTNPRWQQFKNLFRFVDQGNDSYSIPGYNGGLFAKHPVDEIELPDDPWTNFFLNFATYDFRDEVNLDVLGHLFERSITELEKLKESGLFGGDLEKARRYAEMPQSVKRKQLGIYYTPAELTSRIVQYTVEELIAERFAAAAIEFGVPEADAKRGVAPDDAGYWRRCLDILVDLKIVDPACGSGAFLFQAYNALEARYIEVVGHLDQLGDPEADHFADQIPHMILGQNLYGVDLSPEAVEITQLALWIRSATPGQTLATLSRNIVHGNSLVHDPEVHPDGFNWREQFPEVFNRATAQPTSPLAPSPSEGRAGEGGSPAKKLPKSTRKSKTNSTAVTPPLTPPPQGEGNERGSSGFDCVIGNPPWERIKLQEREFFSLPAPEIATATNAAKRRQLVAKLESSDPALYERYEQALASADALLTYCRKSKQYPLTGRGDINLYAVFAELAYDIVAPHGRVGLLTPSGIASDKTTMDFFAAIAESNRLIRLFDFENKKNFFPDVHASFKFCILNFGGAAVVRKAADFVFFAHRVEELEDRRRHVALSGADIRLLNPNTRTCPIFRTKRDAEITKAIYRRVPVLIDQRREGPTGNPWGVKFKTMFHQTNDAELFREPESLQAEGFKLHGNRWTKGKQVCLPVYEAKMVQAYDHRAASVFVDESNWFRQGQTDETSEADHKNPEFLAIPRWWMEESKISQEPSLPAFLAFKNVTSPTNRRTMIAAMIPRTSVGNSAPLILVDDTVPKRHYLALLANLNSFALDYIARSKVGNVNLNFFLIEQFPLFSPDDYAKPCPWNPSTSLETWISERVLKLTCTAEDLLPLAEACDFTAGSFQKEYGGRLNKWDERERAQLLAELDAAYFHLYGLSRDDAEYVLSTFNGINDRSDLFAGHLSIAERVLAEFDALSDA